MSKLKRALGIFLSPLIHGSTSGMVRKGARASTWFSQDRRYDRIFAAVTNLQPKSICTKDNLKKHSSHQIFIVPH
jgi:hypothetical protein